MTATTTRSRNGSHSVFVGDDAHITASTDPHNQFSTDLYVRDTNYDTLVSLYLSPLALRELRDTCDRAIKSIEFEEAKRAEDEPTPYAPREESDEDAERAEDEQPTTLDGRPLTYDSLSQRDTAPVSA